MKKGILMIISIVFWALSFSQMNCEVKIDSNSNQLDFFIEELTAAEILSKKDKNDIPNFIHNALECLIEEEFSIANSDEPFNGSCIHYDSLPDRQIDYLGISPEYLLMTYTIAGGGGSTGHILIIKYHKERIQTLWKGFSWIPLTKRDMTLDYLKKSREHKVDISYYLEW